MFELTALDLSVNDTEITDSAARLLLQPAATAATTGRDALMATAQSFISHLKLASTSRNYLKFTR